MAIVYGAYESWLSETFFVQKDKAYNTEDPYVAQAMRKCPAAFISDPPQPDAAEVIEAATANPGEVRRSSRRG